MIRRLASLPAVRTVPFPRFVGTIKALRLPAAPPAALRCLRLAVPRVASWFRSHRLRRNGGGPGVLVSAAPGRMLPVETTGSPKFLGNPHCFFARFYDSGGTACPPCHDGAAAWPPLEERRRLPHWDFRSSMAWLQSSLSTLRRLGHPSATQDSLPGAGQALLGGLAYPQGFDERFRAAHGISASFPELSLARSSFLFG